MTNDLWRCRLGKWLLIAPISKTQIKSVIRCSQNRGINSNKAIFSKMAIPLTSNNMATLECRSVINMMNPVATVVHSQGSKTASVWLNICPPSNTPAARMCRARLIIRILKRKGRSLGLFGYKQDKRRLLLLIISFISYLLNCISKHNRFYLKTIL